MKWNFKHCDHLHSPWLVMTGWREGAWPGEISQRRRRRGHGLRTGRSGWSRQSRGSCVCWGWGLISWTCSSVSCRWGAWVWCSPWCRGTVSDSSSSEMEETPPVTPDHRRSCSSDLLLLILLTVSCSSCCHWSDTDPGLSMVWTRCSCPRWSCGQCLPGSELWSCCHSTPHLSSCSCSGPDSCLSCCSCCSWPWVHSCHCTCYNCCFCSHSACREEFCSPGHC